MASDFFYLLSTLPMLRFDAPADAPAPADLLALAKARLSAKETRLAESLRLCPPRDAEAQACVLPAAIVEWYRWQTCLRNAIAAHRARHLHRAAQPSRPESDAYPGDVRRIQTSLENPDAVSRQTAWERLQWEKLEELSAKEYYNFPAFLLYLLKAMLLQERRAYHQEEGKQRFESVCDALQKQAEAHRVSNES